VLMYDVKPVALTDAIRSIRQNNDKAERNPVISEQGPIFDLNGRRVLGNSSLPKGVYISGNRKILHQ